MKKWAVFVALLALLAAAIPAASAANMTTAQGGNITRLDFIMIINYTRNWQGFAGRIYFGTNASSPTIINATGSNVNASNLFFKIDCDNPVSATGFVFFSNSSTQPAGLAAGNLSVLDSVAGSGADSGSATFTKNSSFAFTTGTVANVPTTYTFVNQTPQSSSFREGYLNQGNDIVFATVIEKDLRGYNDSFFDYQMLVPAPNLTTMPYFVFSDITFSCFAPGPGPAGGSKGSASGGVQRCIPKWNCTAWSRCGPEGTQWRECVEQKKCEFAPAKPPSSRFCSPEMPLREEAPEIVSGEDIITPAFLRNLALEMKPAAGMMLMPTPVEGMLTNKNLVSVEDAGIRVSAPEILVAPAPAHPYPRLFWSLGGWSDHGTPGARVFSWKITGLEGLKRVAPRSAMPVSFAATPPIMLPGTAFIGVDVLSGDMRVASARVPFTVLAQPFAVFGAIDRQGVLAAYYIVDNRGKEGKDINIEVDLNRRKSTLVAELIGPLRVPEDSVAIFGHEYRLGRAGLTADRIDARLLSGDSAQKATYYLR